MTQVAFLNLYWLVCVQDTQEYMCLLCTVTAAFYVGSLVLYGFIIHWFAAPACGLNIFFVVFQALLMTGGTVVSVVPRFEGSILPASVVILYSMYLLFDGLIAQPRDSEHEECNKLQKHFDDSSVTSLILGLVIPYRTPSYVSKWRGVKLRLFCPPVPAVDDDGICVLVGGTCWIQAIE